MKHINKIFWLAIATTISFPAFCAGLASTEAGMKTLKNSIHTVVGIVFAITGIIVGVLIWRGNKTWEECSKWVIGVAFAGGAGELINIFFI